MKQHRIYSYVGQKFMFLGLTLTEWFIAVAGFMGFFFCESFLLKILDLVGTAALLLTFKRLRKTTTLSSYFYWHVNLGPKRVFLPDSYKRRWWGR